MHERGIASGGRGFRHMQEPQDVGSINQLRIGLPGVGAIGGKIKNGLESVILKQLLHRSGSRDIAAQDLGLINPDQPPRHIGPMRDGIAVLADRENFTDDVGAQEAAASEDHDRTA